MKMGVNIYYLELMFILLNIFQQQKLMKKVILTETLFFKKKDRRHQKKNLNCEFIRINTSRKNYDASYEASRIQTFICNSNKNKLKKLEDELKKFRLQSANLSVENNDNDLNKNNNNNKYRLIIKIFIFIVKSVINMKVIHFQKKKSEFQKMKLKENRDVSSV